MMIWSCLEEKLERDFKGDDGYECGRRRSKSKLKKLLIESNIKAMVGCLQQTLCKECVEDYRITIHRLLRGRHRG